jgi:YegS/Rv2252/BmrU family lipid kinase
MPSSLRNGDETLLATFRLFVRLAVMRRITNAALIVNAQSRRGRALFKQARSLAAERLPYPVKAFAVRNPALLENAVHKALDQGCDLVILGGGDGTISGLVDLLVGRDVALAVLPLGTANSFIRTLGIPLDLEGAMDVIAGGHFRQIDLGMIDRDYFANVAAIGLSPMIAATVPHRLKAWAGRMGYLLWAVWQFFRFRPFTLIVDDGTGEKRLSAVEVRISNGGFLGGTEVVDEAEPDSGEIIVQAVTGRVKSRLIWNWVASHFRLPSRRDNVTNFHGRTIRVETEPPLAISIDGEVLAMTPVIARVAAGVIHVASPSPETTQISQSPF